MDARPCGHPLPDPLESVELTCSRLRCARRIVACVVYVGRGPGDRPLWRIEPTCRKHLRLHEQTARRARHPDHPGVFRHRPDLVRVLGWIHADEARCGLDAISVRTPGD